MYRDFLSYWKPETVKYNFKENKKLQHTASNQLGNCKPEDTIWIITVITGELFLLCKLVIKVITNQHEAKKILKNNSLWPSKYHAINTEKPEGMRKISLKEIATKLRFVSENNDRLVLKNGLVDAKQLQTKRILTTDSAVLLEKIWKEYNEKNPLQHDSIENKKHIFPNEIKKNKYNEGALKKVLVNRYERDKNARKKCIKEHGVNCYICGFNFEKIYGKIGKGVIHVHHIKPLSEIRKEYEPDPINDLIPICPNCHVIIHLKEHVISKEEIDRLKKNWKKNERI